MGSTFYLTKDTKLHLHLISPTNGSIWEITNDFIPLLEKEFIVTKEWDGEQPMRREILLCHFLNAPLFLEPDIFDSFETKILIQPIDGTKLKKIAVDMLNCFDLILTPAEAGKIIMEKAGVKVPIKIIPNYYKNNLFEKKIWTDIEKYVPKDKIVFYHESSFHPRKGIEILYESFIRAFADTPDADRVVLVVKDLPYIPPIFLRNEEIKKQAIKLQKTYKKPPLIIKFSTFLNEDELKTLWNLTNVYVSLAKIEGFGIPMLRMFLMNKPIIALRNENSGYVDYLEEGNSYLIDCIQVEAKDEFMWIYEKETQWGIPNIGDVVNIFRQCLSDYDKNDHRCMKNTYNAHWEENFEKYSLETITQSYINEIKNSHNQIKS